MKNYTIDCNGHRLELGKKTCIMGVLNVTPDSFSDGGKFIDTEIAIKHAEKMVEEGAGIIDIGGESTRPFATPVSQEEELKRVIPVIEAIAGRINVPVSIDTTKAFVAKEAVNAGASIINDVSSFAIDPEVAKVAADSAVPVMLMHMKGTPKTMQLDPSYEDFLKDIIAYLDGVVKNAVTAGIERSKIIIDPGIGFGKTVAHNLGLIKELSRFEELDLPILIGTSRKSFIRKIVSDKPDTDPLSEIVETGTQATVAASILNGAHIVRVHNVAETATTVKIIDAIKNAGQV